MKELPACALTDTCATRFTERPYIASDEYSRDSTEPNGSAKAAQLRGTGPLPYVAQGRPEKSHVHGTHDFLTDRFSVDAVHEERDGTIRLFSPRRVAGIRIGLESRGYEKHGFILPVLTCATSGNGHVRVMASFRVIPFWLESSQPGVTRWRCKTRS